MKHLFESGCYLFDIVELNKFSSKQTPTNALLDFIQPYCDKKKVGILHADKHTHSEFPIYNLLAEKGCLDRLEDYIQILNRLKPLQRKVKNLTIEEKYLLQLVQFCLSEKNLLIVDQISFLHQSNLKLVSNLIQSDFKNNSKTILIIDRKEKLWEKEFHNFISYSLTQREAAKIAS